MELKQKLQDYTEPEFLNFVKKIWAVDVPENEHDKLVMHFDKICQHPMGADLIFYSDDFGNESSPEDSVASLKLFLAYKGLPGFKQEPPGNKPVSHDGSDTPIETPNIYIAPLATAAEGPLVMAPAAGAMAAFTRILPAVQAAILKVVAQLTRMAAAGSNEAIGKYANILLFSTKLGNGERYAVSVPLSELAPLEGRDWQSMARAGGEADLPFRLGSGVVIDSSEEMAQVYIAPTDGKTLPSSVRVRAAMLDPHQHAYSFTCAGSVPITLVWTPENRTTALSTQQSTPSKKYRGVMIAPSFPKIDTFSAISDVHFDDYIIVFPANSGLTPLYVMFKNRLS